MHYGKGFQPPLVASNREPQPEQNMTNSKIRGNMLTCPVPLTECARMMSSLLFAAYSFCLRRSFFICSVSFLFAAFLFYLQRFFFVCSISFLFAAFLFYLQRFFFICSVSFLFAACPLWAIVELGRQLFFFAKPKQTSSIHLANSPKGYVDNINSKVQHSSEAI